MTQFSNTSQCATRKPQQLVNILLTMGQRSIAPRMTMSHARHCTKGNQGPNESINQAQDPQG